MKLNYSLTSGFASGDGATPTRANVNSWIAWAPIRLGTDQLPSTLFLAPRSIPLSADTILLGIPVGELGSVDVSSVDPQRLSYKESDGAPVELGNPVQLEAVRVVAAADRAGIRAAQSIFDGVAGERQFHVMSELYEADN